MFLFQGMGDTTSALAWFYKEPRTFVTGINNKVLRVHDLRGKFPDSWKYGRSGTEANRSDFLGVRICVVLYVYEDEIPFMCLYACVVMV